MIFLRRGQWSAVQPKISKFPGFMGKMTPTCICAFLILSMATSELDCSSSSSSSSWAILASRRRFSSELIPPPWKIVDVRIEHLRGDSWFCASVKRIEDVEFYLQPISRFVPIYGKPIKLTFPTRSSSSSFSASSWRLIFWRFSTASLSCSLSFSAARRRLSTSRSWAAMSSFACLDSSHSCW